MNDPLLLLREYWHYDAFRPFQQEIITAVLSGKDTLALLPTGAGKSVCYQLPALVQKGFCLVISPLIALMQDQVLSLQERGIPAAFIHSGMTQKQIFETLDRAAYADFKILYVSPERLQTQGFQQYASTFDLNLIAVDEAHCISQWGHDFRPAYRKIKNLKNYFPQTPVLALTATANKRIQEDIISQLALNAPAVFRQSIIRKNLFYNVRYTENKTEDLKLLFSTMKGSSILYSRSRRKCAELAMQLKAEGIHAAIYHAGLGKEERRVSQEQWQKSNDQVMSATTAFGMGIDKSNVRTVAHYDVPDSIEEYYQETGRAGRDGKKAHGVLLYNQTDIARLEKAASIHYPSPDFIRKIYQNVGDFLQLPVGKGSETLFSFEVMSFVHNFKLETLKSISAIKLIEQEGYWQWNENLQTKPVVQFTTHEKQLAYLAKSHPFLSHITTGLLRLHGSIFNFPTALKLFDTARLLRMDVAMLHKGLSALSDLGIISYQPALSGGTLFWLHDRVSPPQLLLNKKRIAFLRHTYEERVQAMIAYIQEDTVCRNIQLAHYFGEVAKEACGQCDVCRSKTKSTVSVKTLKKEIKDILKLQPEITTEVLAGRFPATERSQVIETLRDLSEEGFCDITPTGKICTKI